MRLGYLTQELREEEKEQSVYDFCQGWPGFLESSPRELARTAGKMGLDPGLFYSDQKMGSLSGGEKVKVQLACILLGEPDVLLLDEPSNDLDLPTLDFLEKLILESPVPVLYISHDEVLLEHTANLIIHLELVRRKTVPRVTVQRSGYRDYVERRLSGLHRQEQQAANERREYAKQQERFRQIQQKVGAWSAVSQPPGSPQRLSDEKEDALSQGPGAAFPEGGGILHGNAGYGGRHVRQVRGTDEDAGRQEGIGL